MPREVESAAYPTEPLHYCPFLCLIFCPTCQSQCSHISALCQPRLWRRNSTFPTMTFQFFHCSLTIPSLHYSSAFFNRHLIFTKLSLTLSILLSSTAIISIAFFASFTSTSTPPVLSTTCRRETHHPHLPISPRTHLLRKNGVLASVPHQSSLRYYTKPPSRNLQTTTSAALTLPLPKLTVRY